MNITRTLQFVGALALGFSAASSYGLSYDYSYTFEGGLVVSGTLDGNANGDIVENVSNVTVNFNGVPMSGTPSNPTPIIYAVKSTGIAYVAAPVVSFDVTQNNFIFANSNLANDDFSFDSFFEFLGYAYGTDTDLSLGGFDNPAVQARWSLTASTENVADAGATLPLLSVALAGLVWFTRRRGALA